MRERLIELQRENDWTDGEMARRLGVPRTTWSALKHGRIGLSLRMARAAVTAFPELEAFLLVDTTRSEQAQKPVGAVG